MNGQVRHDTRFASQKQIKDGSDEKKSYQFLADLLSEVLSRVEQGNAAAQPLHPHLPSTIASEPAPSKSDAIRQHRSRFNR